jgi:spore coat polysaccharide biosynthesis predicted glycosyltransferase SpsG
LLNPNVGAEQLAYPNVAGQIKWLGSQFALLRRQFVIQAQIPYEVRRCCSRLLICFGGGDPNNYSLLAIQALYHSLTTESSESLHVTIVLGPANPHRSELEAFISRETIKLHSKIHARIHIDIRDHEEQMAKLMAQHDLLITQASTLALESASIGLPCAFLLAYENQSKLGDALQERGIAIKLADYRDAESVADFTTQLISISSNIQEIRSNYELRRLLSEQGRQVVRADGAERVASEILAHVRLR